MEKKKEEPPLFSRKNSDKSDASDINEKAFLSTLEVANEKIQVYKHLFYNRKPRFEKETYAMTQQMLKRKIEAQK